MFLYIKIFLNWIKSRYKSKFIVNETLNVFGKKGTNGKMKIKQFQFIKENDLNNWVAHVLVQKSFFFLSQILF